MHNKIILSRENVSLFVYNANDDRITCIVLMLLIENYCLFITENENN